jgi:hypothetical protein
MTSGVDAPGRIASSDGELHTHAVAPLNLRARARAIAFFLPQFHPIPENDTWWGTGFTEWTNVAKAQPLFNGHYQPRLPADLGYYDLRVPEVREAQAEFARNSGIEGFCYYHYWFNGRRLLERPFNEVVASGKPDFPFCLCWANESWTGIWHGAPGRVLVEQTYPGEEDNRRHFFALREAFLDTRYIRINSRPIFLIYKPIYLSEVRHFIDQWQELAIRNGLPGIHFIAHLEYHEADWDFRAHGFSSCVVAGTHKIFRMKTRQMINTLRVASNKASGKHQELRGLWQHAAWRRYRATTGQFSNMRLYRHARPFLIDDCPQMADAHPCVIPGWDNTARSNRRGVVLHDSTPELFGEHLRDALEIIEPQNPENRMLFIKAWNEWAEGNYLEPDRRFGHSYLNVLRKELLSSGIKDGLQSTNIDLLESVNLQK